MKKMNLFQNIFFLIFFCIPPENYDAFHSLIWHDELARAGSGGLMASLFLPLGWGMLPVIKYGLQPNIKSIENKILNDLISGKKTISLGVSEPKVGSDVNNLETYTLCLDTKDPWIQVVTF